MPPETRAEIVELYKTSYYDFGPLLTSEYLLEHNGIKASKETVRKILMEEGLWQGKKARAIHRRARERRSCFGELIQLDSSLHHWLGEDQPPFWLINCIDDATSRIDAIFVETDSAETNMQCIRNWIEHHGVPLEIYSDRAGYFVYNPPKGKDGTRTETETQIQRALKELSINQILARSAPAKGRVERSFLTCQDPLVKGLRFHNVKTREDAAAYLAEVFIPRFNEKFAIKPKSEVNAHRTKDGYDLDAIFSIHEERVVLNDNTFRMDCKRYQIDLSPTDPDLRRQKVTIEKRFNGRMAVRKGKVYLKYHLIHD